jgi:hypothetical protein
LASHLHSSKCRFSQAEKGETVMSHREGGAPIAEKSAASDHVDGDDHESLGTTYARYSAISTRVTARMKNGNERGEEL